MIGFDCIFRLALSSVNCQSELLQAYTVDRLIDLHADLSQGTIRTGDNAALLIAVNQQLLGEIAIRSYGPEEILQIYQAICQKRIAFDNPQETLELLLQRADEAH